MPVLLVTVSTQGQTIQDSIRISAELESLYEAYREKKSALKIELSYSVLDGCQKEVGAERYTYSYYNGEMIVDNPNWAALAFSNEYVFIDKRKKRFIYSNEPLEGLHEKSALTSLDAIEKVFKQSNNTELNISNGTKKYSFSIENNQFSTIIIEQSELTGRLKRVIAKGSIYEPELNAKKSFCTVVTFLSESRIINPLDFKRSKYYNKTEESIQLSTIYSDYEIIRN